MTDTEGWKFTHSKSISKSNWDLISQTDVGARMLMRSLRYSDVGYHVLLKWCQENCSGYFYVDHNHSQLCLDSDEDFTMVKLKFT